ncbi:hypothetical protein B0H13DRAFT_2455004 [Mycena leptocephala]|nr:hypothetical protein B0H13DRAFT_2455004 [Mycena leptocephala]
MSRWVGNPSQHEETGGYGNGKKNSSNTCNTHAVSSILDFAAIGGDLFGIQDDDMYHISSNISTVVDLLEDKHVSNDAHDTTIDFAASFLEYWFLPLLTDPHVNDDDTLILLTFDETETYTIQNNVFAVVLGGAIPLKLRGTTDETMYTHHSTLSTVQEDWGLTVIS